MILHHNFCDNVILNGKIKDGGWRDLHLNGMTIDEMKEALQDQYMFDDAVIDRIVFIYKTKAGNKGN